jgi:hypothetical protein
MSYLGLSGNNAESQFPKYLKRNVIERVKSAAGGLFVMGALAAFLPAAPVFAQQATLRGDASRHTVHFVGVDNNVTLEVLDWGGSGKPLVLVAGTFILSRTRSGTLEQGSSGGVLHVRVQNRSFAQNDKKNVILFQEVRTRRRVPIGFTCRGRHPIHAETRKVEKDNVNSSESGIISSCL